MQHTTKTKAALAFLLLLTGLFLRAQDAETPRKIFLNTHQPAVMPVYSSPAAKSTAVTSCTDMINYVGNNAPYFIPLGGPGNAITGIYQTFWNYEGKVLGLEFDAAKSPTASSNPVVQVRIFDCNFSPMTTVPLSPIASVTITSTSMTTYSVTFSTPITITGSNGFAVGIVNSNANSRPNLMCGPLQTSASMDYCWVTDVQNGSWPDAISSYYNLAAPINLLVRPIVTTSVNPNWIITRTSTGCKLPAVYDFINTSLPPSYYVNDPMICPGGQISEIDFGDGSPFIPFSFGAQHPYSILGSYIASYTETYVGWTANCVSTLTINILVDIPNPSFSYTVNGLTVNFTNTSSSLSNFLWNFGDVSTSQQQDPSHTYSSPGTYVVELEGTASCGTVRYSASITITGVGITENTGNNRHILLYPNPAGNILTFSKNDGEEISGDLVIYNSAGTHIRSIEKDQASRQKIMVDVSSLPAGLYFLRLQGEYSAIGSFIKE